MDNQEVYFVHDGKMHKERVCATVDINVQVNKEKPSWTDARAISALFFKWEFDNFKDNDIAKSVCEKPGKWYCFQDGIVKHESECFHSAEAAAEHTRQQLLSEFEDDSHNKPERMVY